MNKPTQVALALDAGIWPEMGCTALHRTCLIVPLTDVMKLKIPAARTLALYIKQNERSLEEEEESYRPVSTVVNLCHRSVHCFHFCCPCLPVSWSRYR